MLVFIVPLVITMVLIPPLMRVAQPLHVMDQPGGRHAHAGPVPKVGGIAMLVGVLVPLLLWVPLSRAVLAYVAGAVVIVAFGVWDDRSNLDVRTKFAGQLLAIFIVMLLGGVTIESLSLTERVALPPYVALPLTALVLLGVTNAINLSDGLDGLAGGTLFMCAALLALLAHACDQPAVLVVSTVLAGSILGFLRFNTYPARIFMGDGGSQFLGYSIAVLAVAVTQSPGTPISAALPLLLLGLPILDTLTVMVLRMREGRSPFAADRRHLHHRLLALGLQHHEAVAIIYLAQLVLLALAWQLRYESDLVIVGVFLALALVAVLGLGAMERGRAARAQAAPRLRQESFLMRGRRWVGQQARLPRWTMRLMALGAGAYLLAVALGVDEVPRDIGWLSLGVAVIVAASLVGGARPGVREQLSQAAVYVAVLAAVYLDHVQARSVPWLQAVKWLALPVLAVAVIVKMRLSDERRFELTPLDVLVIGAALLLPNLPGLSGAASDVGLTAAKAVVGLYAVEMLHGYSRRARFVMQAAIALCATALAIRGLVPL